MHHRARLALVSLITTFGTGLVLASPAWAHATFTVTTQFPVNTDQAVTLAVPNEREDTDFNTKVVTALPAGWDAACPATQPSGWTCERTVQSGAQVIRFAMPAPSILDQREQFAFTVHTGPTPGTYAFPTIQTYETGEEVAWIGGGGEPAPQLTTVPAGVTPSTLPPTVPPTHSTPTTAGPASPAPGASPTTAAPAPGSPNRPGVTTTTSTLPVTTAPTTEAPTEVPGSTAPGADAGSVPAPSPRDRGTLPSGGAVIQAETAAGGAPSGGSGNVPVLAGVGVLALAAVGGAAFFRLRGNGDLAPSLTGADATPGAEAMPEAEPTAEPGAEPDPPAAP